MGIKIIPSDPASLRAKLKNLFMQGKPQASVLLICLIFIGTLWANLFEQLRLDHKNAIEHQTQQNSTLARVLEEHVTRTLRAAEITLRQITEEYRQYGRKFNLAQYAKDRSTYLDPYTILSISDENGDAVMGSVPAPKPMNYRKNDNNQFHEHHDTDAVFIGKPRFGTTTGKWTVYLSIRINKPDGSFGGVAVLGMDPAYFAQIYAELDLGKDAVIAITGRDGIVRARSTNKDKGNKLTAGHDVSKNPLFTQHLPVADHGSFIGEGTVDGIGRMLSYRALNNYPLIVLVGTSQAVALANYENRRSTSLQATSVITVAILALGLLALLQIVRLNRERMQKELIGLESRQRLQNILDGIFAFVGLYTPDGILIEVNRTPLDAAGLKREDVIGKLFWDTYWWSHSQESQAQVRNALRRAAQGEIVRDDFRVRLDEDRFILIDAMFGPLRDEAGHITQIVGSGVDVTGRIQAEQALFINVQRLEQVQKIGKLGYVDWDLTTNKLILSDETIAIFGLDKEKKEHTLEEVTALLPAEEKERVEKSLRAAITGAAAHDLVHQMVRPDGRTIWVRAAADLTCDSGGKPIRLLGAILDITEIRQKDEALRISELQLNEAQRIAQLGSWQLDLVINKLTWSDEIFRIFEIDQTKFGATYEAFLNAIHPEDREAVNAAYTGSLVTRKPYDLTHRLLLADGRIKYVHEHCESEFDTAGKPLRSLGTVQDITEHKRAEQQTQRLSSILEESWNEIYIFDVSSLNFVLVNRGARSNLGYTMEELRKLTPADLEPEHTPESFAALVAPLLTGTQRLIRFATAHRRKDGSIYPVEVYLQIFSDELSPVFVAIIIDVTERRHAEIALRELNRDLERRVLERTVELKSANKELETFNYTVAHDLRAPLRGIDGYSRLLLAGSATQLDDVGRGFLQNIMHATQHMGQLIDDLLAYSRLERRDMEILPVDLRTLIESLLAAHADEIKARAVAVSMAAKGCTVNADREGLTMALRNLLENALKFTRNTPKPVIEISGRNAGRTCIVTVRDNGPGFDMEYHDRIFGIFERLHRSEDYPGTGVGLAIVKKAMDRMGGRAWAESAPGKGATFYLEIPK